MVFMDISTAKTFGLAALTIGVFVLGWLVYKRSVAMQPIYGGVLSSTCNYLSGTCFAAILPTVLMTVLVFHPENVSFAGLVWHPLLLAVLMLGLGSYAFALLHALFERGPLERATQQKTALEERGWTEADAKASGL